MNSSSQGESAAAFRKRLLGSAISTYAVCLLIVPLKIWCRLGRMNGGGGGGGGGGAMRLGWDDALSFLSLIFVSVFFFIGILGLGPQIGKHVGGEDDISFAQLLRFLKFLFAEQVVYLVCVCCNKFVLLAFYWRLFSIRARIPLLVLMGGCAAWLIGTIIGLVLNCNPIAAQWDVTIADAKCTGPRQLYIGASIPNILTDILLLLTPLPYIWTLHTPLPQRLLLGGIFLLGCFITVVSSLRLGILMHVDLASTDYTYKMKEVLLWSVVEVNVGLVCACLPSLKPAGRVLGLGRLFRCGGGSGRAGDGGGGQALPAFVVKGDRVERKKGATGGLFSSLAGNSKFDDEEEQEEEEDTYQMVERSHQRHGRVETSVECERRSTMKSAKSSKEWEGIRPVIVAKRDWSVLVETREGDGL